jgi:transposase
MPSSWRARRRLVSNSANTEHIEEGLAGCGGRIDGLFGGAEGRGLMSRDQGISKAGNPKARTVMIELAWLWLRNQPNSPLSIWFRERVGTAKGRIRRIAIVAMARKLLIALWRYLETGVVPTATVLKG